MYDPVQARSDNGNFRALMGIGEGGHAHLGHETGLKSVAAGRAVFQYYAGNFPLYLLDKFSGGGHILPQALAQRLSAVTAKANSLVIVYLHVAKAVVFKSTDNLFSQILLNPGVTLIPEAAEVACEHLTVTVEKMVGILIGSGCAAHVFNLKPKARYHACVLNLLHSLIQSLREERFRYIVVTHGDIPRHTVFLVPAAVYNKVLKSLVPDSINNGANILM